MRAGIMVFNKILVHRIADSTVKIYKRKSHLQQLLGRRSFLRILGERGFNEIMERRTPLVAILQCGRLEAGFGHEEKRSHRVQVEHRRLQLR